MKEQVITELLELELNVYQRKLEAARIEAVRTGVKLRPTIAIGFVSSGRNELEAMAPRLQTYLRALIQETCDSITRLKRRDSEFKLAFARTIAEEGRRQLVLSFAQDLGASKRQLRKDARAFSRWFGEDAVRDRFLKRLNATERSLSFYLERFGVVSALILKSYGNVDEKATIWSRLVVEETIRPLLVYEGDTRVVCAAFKSLSRALRELPFSIQERCVEESTLQFIYRSAMQARQDIWIQCEALTLLQSLSPRSLRRVLERRLSQPGEDGDIFLRRRALKIIGESIHRHPDLFDLLPVVKNDPSAFVRQGLAALIPSLDADDVPELLRALVLNDMDSKVRAAALCASIELLERPEKMLWRAALEVLRESLEKETDSFTSRVGIRLCVQGLRFLVESGSDFAMEWDEGVAESLSRLHTESEGLDLRRWAGEALEANWSMIEPLALELRRELEIVVPTISRGQTRAIDSELIRIADEHLLGRVASVLSQSDFGLEIQRGRFGSRMTRGHRFGFRLWRFIHEMRHPSPDKRQAFPHTIGRHFRADLRVPSAILSELAETKVPGEPLFIAEEQGWRPYLPLMDDIVGSLDRGWRRPIKLFTSEGVTIITPPKGIYRRVRAYADISWKFPRYARLRNWRGRDDGPPKQYLETLEKLGFQFEIEPHMGRDGNPRTLDPEVSRFFPAAIPFFDSDLIDRMSNYVVSVYENTLFELGIFAGLLVSLFAGRHLICNYTLRKARNNIPLVLGGWGTRGKSGTERIKAALFSALGYGFVSKTTGCEAMFLYANTYGKTREMFLFRPYDKATIWEQRDVVRISEKIGTDIFLWECMGLTPSYVKILQRQWMRDDISTITNTYPDHEDLQGPAGVNIPEVMCEFIGDDSTLFSSEEQMLPILADASEKLGTKLNAVGWLEAGIIPDDVLERFPYEEHPFNIALVQHLALELGIDGDYALKEMADKVVADIGVLKTYPRAYVRSRILEFTNGMSANERHGCLGNWTRLEFDKQDPIEDPSQWICTVVNNRSDRIARSRVFADILVRDIAADRHVLIGNNLMGLRGYIRESWEAHCQSLSLFREDDDGAKERPVAILEELFQRMRLPTDSSHIEKRLRVMLKNQKSPIDPDKLASLWKDIPSLRDALAQSGLGTIGEEIVTYATDMTKCLEEFESFRGTIEGGASPAQDDEFRELLWRWFNWKIVSVDDYFASGDQVIQSIANSTPPGLHVRIMGLQNIKGTGLDFVYRWQAWETGYGACKSLRSNDVRELEQGLKDLAGYRDYGVLSEEYVRETLEIVRRSPIAQREQFQAELGVIESNLAGAMKKVNEQFVQASGSGKKRGKWLEGICSVLEEILDSGDAVRRRKIANVIYRDLIGERISSERAALELQALNKRQKGGWLYKRVASTLESIKRRKVLPSFKR